MSESKLITDTPVYYGLECWSARLTAPVASLVLLLSVSDPRLCSARYLDQSPLSSSKAIESGWEAFPRQDLVPIGRRHSLLNPLVACQSPLLGCIYLNTPPTLVDGRCSASLCCAVSLAFRREQQSGRARYKRVNVRMTSEAADYNNSFFSQLLESKRTHNEQCDFHEQRAQRVTRTSSRS